MTTTYNSTEIKELCSCGEAEATLRCGWCDENYCEGCIEMHSSDEYHYWDDEEEPQ